MALRIRIEGDPVLRRVARPVRRITPAIGRLSQDMLKTMYKAEGVGLAAPQVGQSIRLIVVDIGEGPLVLVNPDIRSTEGKALGSEGCLSVPGATGRVQRDRLINVEAQDLRGDTLFMTAEDLLARVIQHEMDHLNGVLFVDRAEEIVRAPAGR